MTSRAPTQRPCQRLLLLSWLLLLLAVLTQDAKQHLWSCSKVSGVLCLLQGANAAFVDTIMLGGPNNNSLSTIDGLTPTYSTADGSFSMATYNWENGRWTAPKQQKQWWEGRRPPDHQYIDLYLNEPWDGREQVAPWSTRHQPYHIPFYYLPRDFDARNLSAIHESPEMFTLFPNGAPFAWRGQNRYLINVDPGWITVIKHLGNGVSTNGSQQCRTVFKQAPSCTDVPVYAPKNIELGPLPDYISSPYDAILTSPAGHGWHWATEAVNQQSNYSCDLALRDLVSPVSQKVMFRWSSFSCGATWRARPFYTDMDTLGSVVYDDKQYTRPPNYTLASYQAVDLFLAQDETMGAFPTDYMSGDYDYADPGFPHDYYYQDDPERGDISFAKGNLYGKCNGPLHDDDTCTLSISPPPEDVWTKSPACAESLQQGVPILVCRDASNNIIPMPPPYASQSATPKLRFKAAAKSDQSADLPEPAGLLPSVACNRMVWSKRFGGRCAAPVVQHLAYDEAYHTQYAQDNYSIPEYGGCLDGGLMRFIAQLAEQGTATYWDDPGIRSWFTPPMWPFTAWRAATTNTDAFYYRAVPNWNDPDSSYWARVEFNDTSAAKTLYGDWVADKVNNNQTTLDSLFVYQKVFELPATKPSSGCTRIMVYKTDWFKKCLVVREPALINAGLSSGLGWVDYSKGTSSFKMGWSDYTLTVDNCNETQPLQCFQVEGDLGTGARIMHRGLCIGVDPSDSDMPKGFAATRVVNLRPCDEGLTTWTLANNNRLVHGGYALYAATGDTLGLILQSQIKSFMVNSVQFAIHKAKSQPAWPSYSVLRQFWLDSFATSAADIRAHRIRFVPAGARQGLNTRGAAGDHQGCNGTLETWHNESSVKVDNCEYNVGVNIGGTIYDRDSCMDQYLNYFTNSSSAARGTPATPCWTGQTWMYQYGNGCDKLSSDLRFSTRLPGGANADKCSSRVGGQYVAVDDLWSFMASDRHDPCGWPFVECVPECALPSNPAVKGWTVQNGAVLDPAHSNRQVGCLDSSCGGDSKPMADPTIANKIGAIDWRNMTLYSANLNFSAFKARDALNVTAGSKVWYLNLNFNMLGGDLSQLAELPDIFPNLVHLGLAHCSAGKYAPEYAWQQTQPDMCKLNSSTTFVDNPACYCPDDSWKDMTVVTSVGAAMKAALNGANPNPYIATGVTRRFYGTIPESWGMKDAATPAAWSKTLMSVNLAGHFGLHGGLPSAWYKQDKFPRLYYLKLKGTQIRPYMGDLQWNAPNDVTCQGINWAVKTLAAGSAAEWVKYCVPSTNCTTCDWWPSRSAAPWYFDGTEQRLTCGAYLPPAPQGGQWARFPCWEPSGYHFNDANNASITPNNDTCCTFVPTCGLETPGGGQFKCRQPNMVFKQAAENSTAVNNFTCCESFVPTCGKFFINGTSYPCPSDGVKYNLINPSMPNPQGVADCCVFVPTCQAIDTSRAKFQCPAPRYTLDTAKLTYFPPTRDNCCTSATCTDNVANTSAPAGFPPGISYVCDSSATCCWFDTCKAVAQYDENGTVNATSTAMKFACPTADGWNYRSSSDNFTDITVPGCCYTPTCGAVDEASTPYTCPTLYALNPVNKDSVLGADNTQNTAVCCYKPTCAEYTPDGSPFPCNPDGYVFSESHANDTNPDAATCCRKTTVDLSLVQDVTPKGTIYIGAAITITLTFRNWGLQSARDVIIKQTLPTGVVVTTAAADCPFTGQTMTCNNIATVPAESATTSYVVQALVATSGTLNFIATANGTGATDNLQYNRDTQTNITVMRTCGHYNSDGTPYDCTAVDPYWRSENSADNDPNPSRTVCCVELKPDLVLTSTPTTGQIDMGGTLSMMLNFTNHGTYAADGATANQTLPAGLEFVAPAPTGCNISSDLHVLTCGPAATLPNDSTTATSYQATIKGVAVGAHTVSASVTVARDQDATNNAAQSTVTVTATCQHYDSSGGWFPCGAKFKANTANAGSTSPDKPTCCIELFPVIGITQALSAGGSILIGESATLTITLTNMGEWEGTTVSTTQTLTTGLQYTGSAPAGCTFPSPQTTPPSMTCSLATLAANGGSTSYAATVKATSPGTLTVSAQASESAIGNLGPASSTITVGQTCKQYKSDGTQIDCNTGYEYDSTQDSNPNPTQAVCCKYVPLCGAFWANGTAYQCPPGYRLITTQLSNPTPNDANCCEYDARCGNFWPNGTGYPCSSGTEPVAANSASTISNAVTSANNAVCCQEIDSCVGDPCDGKVNAVAGSCSDIPAPGTGYTCNCVTGYTWNTADNTCTDKCVYGTIIAAYCQGHGTGACTAGVCTCQAGWEGDQCQYDANGCASNPCSTTPDAVPATCVDVAAPAAGYSCSCQTGFSWDSATASCKDTDSCAVVPNPCSTVKHAVANSCVDLAAPATGFTCSCETGYSWNASSTECTDDCVFGTTIADYCNGHGDGTCNAGVCGCQPAYSGDRCQNDANGCAGNPCDSLANAVSNSCVDKVAPAAGFTCSCVTGFSWDDATATCVDNCVFGTTIAAYCNNNGDDTCTAGVCGCQAAYTGGRCQFDANGCASNPCNGLANAVTDSCVDKVAPARGYTCSCATGYVWDDSTAACLNADGCAGDPCSTEPHAVAGSCSDVSAPGIGYTCSCELDYTWHAAAVPPACKFVPRCGRIAEAGGSFACPAHYSNNPAAENATTLDSATCCQFVPTCAFYFENGTRFQCPTGMMFNADNAAATSPDAAKCCRTPAQGECPTLDLQATLSNPEGSTSSPVPVLVTFPVAESLLAYCPQRTSQNGQPASSCQIKIQSVPMFSYPGLTIPGQDSTAPADGDGSVTQKQYACVDVSALSCQIQLDLPKDGRWSVTLVPSAAQTLVCEQPVTVKAVATEIVLDTKPPILTNLSLAIPPALKVPDYQICTTFSEPVMWVADAASTTTSSSTGGSSSSGAGSSSPTPAAFTSSNILLTNTMLLNISVVPEAIALLPNASSTGAANKYCMWLRTWSGATARVEILGPAFQDIAGIKGQTKQTLQVTAPGSDLMSKASNLASTATAVSAVGAAAAATATGAGGATSILRSIGHTQFLAMSVSLAVPWLPPEYIQLCTGLEWSNLVKPAVAVLNIQSNATTAVSSKTSRRLAEATADSSSSSSDASANTQLAQQHNTGIFQSSKGGSSGTGVYIFATNGSSSTTMAAAGVTRHPKQYTLHELRLSVVTLAVAVAVASVVQWVVAGIWKLLRLNPKNIPTLMIFPKPQVFVYTLLMIPVVYGAGKLLAASDGIASSTGAAAIACIIILPLPVLAFWVYILYNSRAEPGYDMKRTKSEILRAYSSPDQDQAAVAPPQQQQQRAGTTLALLGDDNPTLIIRERHSGEEVVDSILDPASSDDEAEQAGGFNRRPALSQGFSRSGHLRAGAPAPVDGEQLERTGAYQRPVARSFLPTSDAEPEQEPARASCRARPLAEGAEEPLDDEQRAAMAAAWNAARAAGPGSSTGGWAGQRTAAEPMLSSGGVALEGTSADGRRVPARQQTWMGAGRQGGVAAAGSAQSAAAAAGFLDRYWYLVDDLVGDDKAAAVYRVKLSILVFYIASALQRIITAVFFGLFHFSYVSVQQIGVLIAVHTVFIVYLLWARPYASSILLYADILAYTCELTILGAAVYLKQFPANDKVLMVLVTCYFVDVAIMLVPEVLRYAVMAYTWLKRRSPQRENLPSGPGIASDDGSVVARVALQGSQPMSKQQQHHQQQRGRSQRQQQGRQDPAAARGSGASSAGAAAAAAAAMNLSESGHRR